MRYVAIFLLGALGYSSLEVMWRGYTHWTMSLCGGFCFLLIYFLNINLAHESIFFRCLAGALVITATELVAGVTINIVLGWNVWDYSSVPLNFIGQICLPYSVLWFFLCIPVFWICTGLDKII